MNANYPAADMVGPPVHGGGGGGPHVFHHHHHAHSDAPSQHHLPQIPPMTSYHPGPAPGLPDEPHHGNGAPGGGVPPIPPVAGISLPIISKVEDTTNRKYSLIVVQQPKRARMCGFGDKDRRPITPPPCVHLIVTDNATGKEVDCNEIDHNMYVLNVDLWSEDGAHEVNLVRHSSATPSISSTTAVSYQSMMEASQQQTPYAPVLPSSRDPPGYGSPPAMGFHQQGGYTLQQQPYGQPPSSPYVQPNGYTPATQYNPQDFRPDGAVVPSQAGMSPYGAAPYGPDPQNHTQAFTRMTMTGPSPQGMFTRNLIGSLAASAFRLTDTQNRIGIWFVLQDLSVRTEGNFRLRFSFVNVGPPSKAPSGADANTNSIINIGKAPIMAAVYSDLFTVYSAKKFPGVCESTLLSKTFASQGIKIPIRKESSGRGDEDEDY